jgi:excisionase family DNA binding protein
VSKNSVQLTTTTIGSRNFPNKPTSVEELADWMSVSRRFLETQIEKGLLRAHKISPRCIRILPEDVAQWLDRSATATVEEVV